MGWYIVIKTIKRHRYRYQQRTWRESGKVRTESIYLGRADGPTGTATGSKPRSNQEPNLAWGAEKTMPASPVFDEISVALAEYDRLKAFSQDLYDRSCHGPEGERHVLYAGYLTAEKAIGAFQEQLLGRAITIYGGGAGGQLYRNDFEAELKAGSTINTPCKPAIAQKRSPRVSASTHARCRVAPVSNDISQHLAEYDRLQKIAQDHYAKCNAATNENYEEAFGPFLRARYAVTDFQSKVLGERVIDWGGGEGGNGAALFRKSFEAALVAKRDGTQAPASARAAPKREPLRAGPLTIPDGSQPKSKTSTRNPRAKVDKILQRRQAIVAKRAKRKLTDAQFARQMRTNIDQYLRAVADEEAGGTD